MGEVIYIIAFLIFCFLEIKVSIFLFRAVRNTFFSGRRKLSSEQHDKIAQYLH